MNAVLRTLVVALLIPLAATASPLSDGNSAWDRGDIPAALVSWADALAQARAAGDIDQQRDLMLRLAAVHRELGKLAEATSLIDAAAQSASKPQHHADVLVARGRMAHTSGQLQTAEENYQSAFRTYQQSASPKGAANAALNLGLVRLQQGKNDPARKALDAAHTLFRSLSDDRGRGDALTDLALVDRRAGDLKRARSRLEHAIALYRTVQHEQGESNALANLAIVHEQLGNDREAKALLNTALETAKSRKDIGQQAELLFNLGTLAHRAGDAGQALANYHLAEAAFLEARRDDDALDVALNAAALTAPDGALLRRLVDRANKSQNPRLRATALVRAASTMEGIDRKTAKAWELQAAKLADKLELADVRWQVRYLRGKRLADSDDLSGAVKALTSAVDLLERQRKSLDRDDAQGFVHGHEEVYQALVDALLAKGDTLRALAIAERMQLSEQPAIEPTNPDAAHYQQLVAREAWLQGQVADEVGARGDDSERAKHLRDELATLRVDFATTVDKLRATYKDFDRLVRVDPEDLEAMQSTLPPEVTVLQPVLFEDRMVLLLFRHDMLKAVPVDVSRADMQRASNRLSRALRAGMTDRTLLDPLADKLGAWLVAPIAEHLKDTETLVVSASGTFRQIPFSLLRHDGAYLAESTAVVGVTHVGSLRGGAPPFTLRGRDLLLVGNPDGTLAGAEAEVKAIASAQPGATLLIGPQGTRTSVLERARGKSVVHLATHGRIDPVQPDRSYLVLAGDDAESKLAYREIPGLQPWLSSARLLVLSACESGLPVDAPGGDGVVSINGLAAQFRRAGVETLVASLWKVDDEGTKALMRAFYTELQGGKNVGDALRSAQLSLLASDVHSSPWYWGAFIVMGDWR